jgi:pimeloyl-ACP methyl ester carboxylesterase
MSIRKLAVGLLMMVSGVSAAHADASQPISPEVRYRSVQVDGLKIFYREAGPANAPTVLLMHGFPSSSFMYRNLIQLLARNYHVVAPDYPGFGQSDFPEAATFEYTFEHLSAVMAAFTEAIKLKRYALYIQDYGAPIGLRMALRHPDRVTALIVQNGNAYDEGLSAGWDPLRAYWKDPTLQNRQALRGWLTAEGIREQYIAGVPAASVDLFAPETWTLDWALLQRPGNIDMQLDLFGDYRRNVELYPKFQAMFRARRFPTLVVWGKHDPFFTEAGARGYAKDLPHAQLHLLEAGHFALETHYAEIAQHMQNFLSEVLR